MAILLPTLAAATVILTALALTKFAGFVFVMLLVRASVDLAQAEDGSALGQLLLPSTLMAVLFIVASGVWLAAQHRASGGLPGSGLRRALLVFLCAVALSMATASDPLDSAADVLRLLAVVLMFASLERLLAEGTPIRYVVAAVFLSAVFPVVYTSVGYAVGSPPVEVKGELTRVVGTFAQSNGFGRYLMLIIIVGVAVYPHVRGWLKAGFTALLALCGVFLILTSTLTAIVGTVIGLVVVGLRQSKVVLVGALVAAMVAAATPPVSERITSLTTGYSTSTASRANTLDWRLDYWSEILPLAKENPLTGIGFGMTEEHTAEAKQPHNDYIRAFVETGIVGLLAYLGLLIVMIQTGLLAVRLAPAGSLDRSVAVGYLGAAVSVSIASFASNEITDVVLLWYLVAFAAAASAIVLRHRSSALRQHSPHLG